MLKDVKSYTEVPKSILTEQGDVIYADGAYSPAALHHGGAGQILASGGHGANPSWADQSIAMSDTQMTGFISYGGSGNYYSMTTGGLFTVLRPGTGRIGGVGITWAGGESVQLSKNKGYWIGYTATNTIVAIDVSTIISADISVYYTNLYNMMKSTVLLFSIWYDDTEFLIQRNPHPYNYETAIAAHDHFRLGSVYLWTGAKITLLNAGNRTIDSQGQDLIDDHGVLGNVPDHTGVALSTVGLWKNSSNIAQKFHRRNFTVSGVSTAPTAGATYTHNGSTYTVLYTNVGKTLIEAWGSTWVNDATASGTLTKVSGIGDDSINFSAVVVNKVIPSSYLSASVPTPLGSSGATRYGIYAIYAYMDDMQTPSTASPIPGYFVLMSATTYNSAANASASLGTGAGPDMSQFIMPSEIAVLEPVLTGFAITDGNTRSIASYTGGGFVNGVRSYKQTATSTFAGGAISVTAASNVLTDVTNFGGILSASDTNVQLALETIDDHQHTSIKSTSTTGIIQFTGMLIGTTRVKTVRDADDTILEAGGQYTVTGAAWTFNNTITASISGTAGAATTIALGNEASDTTCFPLFVTDTTGPLGAKTNAGLTFNALTGQFQSTLISAATGFIPDTYDGAYLGTAALGFSDLYLASGALINYANGNMILIHSPLYDDWYLPSRLELNQMYLNLKVNGIGGFANSTYWSSSEHDATTAYSENFTNGAMYSDDPKNSNYRVRCIRSFTSVVPSYNLGDVGPSGGWIFYKDGDNYLECATSDQATNNPWITGGSTQTTTNGNTSSAIGTGLVNTNAMEAQSGYTGGAAKFCLDYSVGLGGLVLNPGTLMITNPTNTATSVVTIDGTQTLTNKTLTSPFVNEAVALTTTATKLNYLTSATGTTGTNSTNIVFSTSPNITTPTITTSMTVPLIYGSSDANGDITIRGTSSATKTTSYVILQDDGGNVGIGTTAPDYKLHLAVATSSVVGMRISQANNAVGMNMYLSDGGHIYFDTTINDPGYNVYFRSTTSGTPITQLTLLGTGNVGIGTTTPGYPLHAVGECRNTSGTWVAISDERLKMNIRPINDSLQKVLKLANCVNHYEFINENIKGQRTGFIAQKLLSEGFTGHIKEEIPENDKDGKLVGWEYETIDEKQVVKKEGDKLLAFENNFDIYLYPAIAELNTIIEAQNKRIEILEKEKTK